MAVSAATVIRLRSRLDSPGRSQTSPNSTFSLRSMSFGATGRTTSRAVVGAGCVLTVCSFLCDRDELRTDSTRFGRLTPATDHLIVVESPINDDRAAAVLAEE